MFGSTVPRRRCRGRTGTGVGVTLALLATGGLVAVAGATSAAAVDPVMCNGQEATIVGTGARDVLNGTPGPDVIAALAGADTVFGGEGDDVICGGEGRDFLAPEDGNDIAFGEAGHDDLRGSTGQDTLYGGDGDDVIGGDEDGDVIYGEAGDDDVDGNAGDDEVRGGDGDDLLRASQDVDVVYGDAGDDVMFGGDANDTLYGGPGEDELRPDEGDDLTYGDAGVDTVYGSAGDDVIYGGDDGDHLYGEDGNDTTDGEAGPDSCDAETEISCEVVADIGVTIEDSVDPTRSGDASFFRTRVTSYGEIDTTGVTLVTSFAGASLTIDAVTGPSCTVTGTTITCDVGSLGFLQSETIQIDVTPTSPGEITATSVVSMNEPEATSADNTKSETTTVVPPPPNDDFAHAETHAGSFTAAALTFAATTEVGEPDCSSSGRTAWYALTVPTAGTVSVDTFASDFDTVLGVYTGADLASLTQIACNDDAQGSQSAVTFEAVTGTTYYLQVGGFAGANGDAVINVVAPQAPDVVVGVTDAPDPATVGGSVTYTIPVTNAGAGPASGVEVATTLTGSAASITSATATQGTCSVSGPTATCSLGALAPAANATITVVATPNAAGTITSTSTATLTETDAVPANNTATASTTVNNPPTADLRFDLSASAPLLAGYINYDAKTTNTGPSPSTAATVVIQVPANTVSVSNLSPGCTYDPFTQDVTCPVGALGVNASTTSTFRAKIGPLTVGLPLPSSGTLTAVSPTDPNPSNNSDIANCYVVTGLIILC